jgi:hypothetical protein
MPFITHALLRQRQKKLHAALLRIEPSVKQGYPLEEEQLKKEFEGFGGRLVFRGDRDYEEDRVGHCMAPDLAMPFVIAYCVSVCDVALCLSVARRNVDKLPFTVRSGGHSNLGASLSNGLVIDISEMNDVFVAPDLTHAIVEAGANLGTVNAELERYGLHIPGGECGTVGVAGHCMGGGYGFTSRIFGLNCDAIERVWMMLADGRTVIADAIQNRDLFWAVRGATGNTLGVLLRVQYRTVKLPEVWGFALKWPIKQAPEVLVELQANFTRHGLTHKMGYECAIAPVNGENSLVMMGMYDGSAEDGKKLLEPLPFQPEFLRDKVAPYSELNDYLLDWWELPPPDELARMKEVKRSNYIARPLTKEEWQNIVDFYQSRPCKYNLVAFEAYGGRATAPGVDSAFIHRQVDFDMFIDSFAIPEPTHGDNPVSLHQAEEWAAKYDALMVKYANGHRYQNYPFRNDKNYRWNYWGDAFLSLLFVKNKYDPDNFFNVEQGITPYPESSDVRQSTAPSMFSDPVIVYEPCQRAPTYESA